MTTGNSTRRELVRPALVMELDNNVLTLPPKLSNGHGLHKAIYTYHYFLQSFQRL